MALGGSLPTIEWLIQHHASPLLLRSASSKRSGRGECEMFAYICKHTPASVQSNGHAHLLMLPTTEEPFERRCLEERNLNTQQLEHASVAGLSCL